MHRIAALAFAALVSAFPAAAQDAPVTTEIDGGNIHIRRE